MVVLSWLVYLVTCWIASSPCSMQRRVLCVTIASMTTSLICSGTCTGYGFQKESSFDLPCLLSAVITTRRLRISLTISTGLMKRNHGIDYGPVPVHEWSFLELGSAPLAIDHFVWLSRKHGTVFLPTSLHQLLYRLSRDNLKRFYLQNLSHHFKLLSHIFVPCPRSYLAYATLISTFCYYYYYYRIETILMTLSDLQGHFSTASLFKWDIHYTWAAMDKILTDTMRRAVPVR